MLASDTKLWGRDYSAREFTPADFDRYELENPGERPVEWLWRYIGYPNNRKCISHYPGMYRAHWNAGRPVSLIHQIGYADMGSGYEGGRSHALTALRDARAVGWDGESHIAACMDRFYSKEGFATLSAAHLRNYMRGFRSVLGDRTGFYGFFDSMRDAVREEWASFYVQCGARSAHVQGIHAWQENNYQPRVFGTPTDQLELYCSPLYAFGGQMDQQQMEALGDIVARKVWAHPSFSVVGESPELDAEGRPIWRSTVENMLASLWGEMYNSTGVYSRAWGATSQRLEAKVDALTGTVAGIVALLADGGTITEEAIKRIFDESLAGSLELSGEIRVDRRPQPSSAAQAESSDGLA